MLCCGDDDGRSVEGVLHFALQRTGVVGLCCRDGLCD